MIDQHTTPDLDSEAWVAYLILLEKYPNLTYQSWDGFHCHGICDYSVTPPMVWIDTRLINWETKEQFPIVDFSGQTTRDIIKMWNKIVEENCN